MADRPDMPDMVARRLRYLERQRALMASAAVDAAGRQASPVPQGSGPANRHGMPRLPVGQHAVTTWPVLDLGDQPHVPLHQWRLEVGGLVENPFTLTWDEFLALPQVDDTSDFHCVTTWSRYDNHWRGVRFRTIAEQAIPKDTARFVSCTGYDTSPGTSVPYTTNLPLARAIEDDVLLVHTWEGAPLPAEHGGPCRMITPKLYAWKGTKWLHRIEFLAADRRGFWEVRGYSNTAEPWENDRFSEDR